MTGAHHSTIVRNLSLGVGEYHSPLFLAETAGPRESHSEEFSASIIE